MARAKSNEQGRTKKAAAVDEVNRGIEKLTDLMAQIEDLSREGFPYRDAVRARTELSLRETIRRIFGEKSEEYQTHKSHKLRTSHRAESVQTIAMLKQLAAQLEQQKSDLLGDKPASVEPSSAAPRTSDTIPLPAAPSSTAAIPSPASPPIQPAMKDTHTNSSSQAYRLRGSEAEPMPASVSTMGFDRPTASPDAGYARGDISSHSGTTSLGSLAGIQTSGSAVAAEPRVAIPNALSSSAAPAEADTISLASPDPPRIEAAASTVPSAESPTSFSTPDVPLGTRVVPSVGTDPAPAPASSAPSSGQKSASLQKRSTGELWTRSAVESSPITLPPTLTQTGNECPVGSVPLSQLIRGFGDQAVHPDDPQAMLRKVCTRFHLVARQLRLRRDYRATLEVEDEYDVQDLLYALLRLEFEEVGSEDWCPGYGDGATRTAYLLHKERVVIVAKKTKTGVTARELSEQVKIDAGHYSGRADCRTLVCFVYDPEGRIGNPRGLESDLTMVSDTFTLEVIIAPK